MIEFIIEEDCILCDRCVVICPDLVFDAKDSDIPSIARQEDCQTCYLCEVHCPVDALYVSPRITPEPALDQHEVIDAGLVGSYRRALGWRNGKPAGAEHDLSYRMHETDPGEMGEVWRRSSL